jgi:hypothetical protein
MEEFWNLEFGLSSNTFYVLNLGWVVTVVPNAEQLHFGKKHSSYCQR